MAVRNKRFKLKGKLMVTSVIEQNMSEPIIRTKMVTAETQQMTFSSKRMFRNTQAEPYVQDGRCAWARL